MCPELGHILCGYHTAQAHSICAFVRADNGSGYMPLLQLNRAVRYILYVISQQ